MNLARSGFLMNEWKLERLDQQSPMPKRFKVNPLRDRRHRRWRAVEIPAINEVSLLQRNAPGPPSWKVGCERPQSAMSESGVRRRCGDPVAGSGPS